MPSALHVRFALLWYTAHTPYSKTMQQRVNRAITLKTTRCLEEKCFKIALENVHETIKHDAFHDKFISNNAMKIRPWSTDGNNSRLYTGRVYTIIMKRGRMED